MNLSKYLIFENDYLPPLDFMDKALFKTDEHSTYEQFKNEIEEYDVIAIRSAGPFTYPLFTELMNIFQKTTDHTFLFADDVIDDTLFTILLEYAYATGNRVMYCKNDDELWKAYLKFGKKNVSYYIITFG